MSSQEEDEEGEINKLDFIKCCMLKHTNILLPHDISLLTAMGEQVVECSLVT